MWSLRLVGILLVTAVYTCIAQDYDEWIQVVQNEEDLGKVSLTFNCSNYPVHPQPTIVSDGSEYKPFNETVDKPRSWMLPNLTIVDTNGTIGGGKILISDDYEQMTINNVTIEDFGVYHCMIWMVSEETDRWYLVKWGINMRGPYFEDLWEKYRTNTIIAFSASGGFTAFMIIICLVYQYRWQPPGGDTSEKEKSRHYEDGKVNAAFDHSEPNTSTADNVYYVPSKPPIPSDIGISTEPTVTYSTLTPDKNTDVVQHTYTTLSPESYPDVEEDTRF